MMTAATHNGHDTIPERALCVAFALRDKTWRLGCTTGPGQQPRERGVAAGHQARVLHEVAQATRRFGLPATAPVVSGDAAGRAGFWLHRLLQAPGITHSVVESASIAVNRRRRRATSDGVDVRTWVSRLRRYAPGARDVWRVVQGPSVAAEAQRPQPRDLATLTQERASTATRLTGWLRSPGRRLTSGSPLPAHLEAWRRWAGAPRPSGLRRRLRRVSAHPPFLRQQIAEVAAERRALWRTSPEARSEQVRQVRQLQGIGSKGAGWLVREFFGGRALKHRREVGG